tara:strand:+ start:623 stop:814 length:192 start_codon:yes stop_codon:yes gene_type:complete
MKLHIQVDEFAIWPVFYGDPESAKQNNGDKFRVAAYRNQKVVYERIFNTYEGATDFVKKQEEE